jgi:NhaP-type Na+/H+ or K+/H+ antiporter
MKVDIKLPVALATLMPAAAFAVTEGPVEVFFYAAAGGAVGGLLGALLACWLCKRMGSKNDKDPRK